MIAEVIVDVSSSNVDKVFEYAIPPHLSVKEGQRVVVPFGPRVVGGYVLRIKNTKTTSHNLKNIYSVKPNGHILPEMLKLAEFMVEKYNLKTVDALRLFITSELRSGKVKAKEITVLHLAENTDIDDYINRLPSRSEKQKLVLETLRNGQQPKSVITQKFGESAVLTLIKKGIIICEKQTKNRKPLGLTLPEKKQILLNTDQSLAIKEITKFERQTFALLGVTGSGKTEVYLHAIEKALEKGKTAILLVPEISLTPQVFGLLTARFGEKVAVLHSGLSQGERFDEWQRIENGDAKVVVGARSAVFAPLQNIGIIIVDEEHEGSYKSENHPRYSTHDIALFRAEYNSCPLVLGSATLSVDTFYKTTTGEYKLLKLPNRVHETALPEVFIVDMTKEIALGNSSMFSMPLLNALSNAIHENKQALLFLNRRGYTSFVRCLNCGFVAKCTDCDAPLVYHKNENSLKCHFCGKKYKMLSNCPACNSSHIRFGAIGTEAVVSEVQKLFPNVKVFRMDNDTTTTKNAHQKILEEFSRTKPAILVGTQMIAKGHDFKDVDVVGVLDADQTLYQTDHKSTERTYQLLTQVIGRAGRINGGGKGFLQTYNPRHFVYKFVANNNYFGFFDREINVRETTLFPPFASIVRVLVSHENQMLAYQTTKNLFEMLKPLKQMFTEEIIFLGASASPHTRLKNKFRFQVLLRFTNNKKDDILKEIYKAVNSLSNTKCQVFVEINPSSLG